MQIFKKYTPEHWNEILVVHDLQPFKVTTVLKKVTYNLVLMAVAAYLYSRNQNLGTWQLAFVYNSDRIPGVMRSPFAIGKPGSLNHCDSLNNWGKKVIKLSMSYLSTTSLNNGRSSPNCGHKSRTFCRLKFCLKEK